MALASGSIERRRAELVVVGEVVRVQGTPVQAQAHGLLSKGLMPDALYFVTVVLDGISEANYARRQTYARLRQAVERE